MLSRELDVLCVYETDALTNWAIAAAIIAANQARTGGLRLVRQCMVALQLELSPGRDVHDGGLF